MLELLSGEFGHTILFDPPPLKRGKVVEVRKRTTEQEEEGEEPPVAKKPKEEEEEDGSRLWSDLDLSVKTVKRRGAFKWEEAGGGLVYIMTTDGCEPSKKVSCRL